ncbi:MAG: hypothetical protein WCY82_01970 [Desulfotomaculaceae bacterium]
MQESAASKKLCNTKKALVLGYHTPSFLSVIRSLGRGNVQVHVAWHLPDSIAIHSRYVHQAHVLPNYEPDKSDWKHALIRLMQAENFDLVIPCHDSTIYPLQMHKNELGKNGPLYVLSDEAFNVFFDKIKTNQLARSVDLPLPRELIIKGPEDGKIVLANFNFPIVLKPCRSYNEMKPLIRNTVRKAYNEMEFYTYLNEMLVCGPIAAQEFFPGQGAGVYLLLNAGETLLAFQQVRVHEPLHGGGGTYRKSVALSPELLAASLKLFRPLKYTGVAMVEFKVNPQTGEWVFMEVNARFWGSLPLALASGADFPLALFQLMTAGKTNFNQSYRRGVYCRNLTADLKWQWANLCADRSDRTLITRPVNKVIFEFIINVLTMRERIDTFTCDDPRPGFIELGRLITRTWDLLSSKIKSKLSSLLNKFK